MKTRSKEFGLKFIDSFLPQREESAECYELPQYGDKVELEFDNAEDLMEYLEVNKTEPHRIYWRNLDIRNPNRHGMLFYTVDGYMIFGISREWGGDIADTSIENECFNQMSRFLGTNEGYITYECPPEDTYEGFIKLVKQ